MKKTIFPAIIILFFVASSFTGMPNISKNTSLLGLEPGNVSGFVNDTLQNPLEGARVRVQFHGTYRENYTETSGYYHVTDIPICNCTKNVTASKPGYKAAQVTLSIGTNTTYNFTLEPNPPILYVGGTGPNNYTKIQDAIDNATENTTVFVYDDSSPYYEHIIISKTITLIGENKETTLIDGPLEDDVIYIEANSTTLSGFSIQKSEWYEDHSGIKLRSTNNKIYDNILLNNDFGIYIDRASNNIIRDNIFLNNNNGLLVYSDHNQIFDNKFFNDGLTLSAYHNHIINNTVNYKPLIYLENQQDTHIATPAGQIILVNCENITIADQHITNTITGIKLSRCTHCLIYQNTISECYAGIRLAGSDDNTLLLNSAYSNDAYGIRLYSSHRNLIQQNICVDNLDRSSYWNHGISLYCSSNNTLLENIVRRNGVGIGCAYARDTLIQQNSITYNYYNGIDLEYNSERAIINKNNIRGNKRGVTCAEITEVTITNNNFYDNNEDAVLDIIQYYNFNIRKLPKIDHNHWDRERHLPKRIPGTFTFVYMDVPWGGSMRIRWVYRDWHPAPQPIDT